MKKEKNLNLIKPEEYPQHIFPVIKCERQEEKNTLVLETTARIKHRGKWYLWKFVRNAFVPNDISNFTPAISSFNRDIYLAQLKKQVDIKLKNSKGEYYYKLDIIQVDELTRLSQPEVKFNELEYRYHKLLNIKP